MNHAQGFITGARLSSGVVCYNAWQGEPHQTKHLAQATGEQGLQSCKAACEANFQDSTNNIDLSRFQHSSNSEAIST